MSVAVLEDVPTDELLELLERAGALVGVTRRRELIVLDPPDWWPAQRTEQLDLRLRWAVAGRGSGSEWRRCNVCGREAMRPRRAAGVKCPLTPRCRGRLERRRPALATDDGATPCDRDGCRYAAVVTTYAGTRLCRLDLIEQAIITEQGEPNP